MKGGEDSTTDIEDGTAAITTTAIPIAIATVVATAVPTSAVAEKKQGHIFCTY